MSHNIYDRLAIHLSTLGMGLPPREDLLDILVANLTPIEAEVALLLPTRIAPLQVVSVELKKVKKPVLSTLLTIPSVI